MSSNKTEWSIALALKWSIFIVQKLVLHKNGVEFRQQLNGAICTSLATPFDDVARRRHEKFTHGRTDDGQKSDFHVDDPRQQS